MMPLAAHDLPSLTRDLVRLTDDLDRWGYCLVDQALPVAATEAVRHRVLEQAKAEREDGVTEFGNPVEPGDRVNQWVNMLFNKGRVLIDELALNPVLKPLLRHLLGRQYLLAAIDSHITWPSNSAMQLHMDQWFMPYPAMPDDTAYRRAGDIVREEQPHGPPEMARTPINPPVVVNCFFAATDFSAANGGTRLVPGSHRFGCHPDPAASYAEMQPEVPAGSAIVWEGRTWHGAGINRSDAPRVGISTYFCAPQFRQLCNLTFGTRPDVVAGLGQEERELFGFAPFGGIGNTGELNTDDIVPGSQAVGELRA